MDIGEDIGGLIGGPLAIEPDHAGTASAQLPDISRTDGAVAFQAVIAERWQRIDFAIRNSLPYLLLDYERSSGVWLDAVGEILGVPRDTRSDEYYRRVLSAYAQVIWPRRRTLDGMLEALIRLIGDESGVTYSPAYPKSFIVSLDGFGIDEQLTWDAVRLLRMATPATYRSQVFVSPVDALIGDDASGTVVISDANYVDDASGTVVIPDAGVAAWVV